MKLAEKADPTLVVDLLCSLAQGLTSKWIMNKAQATAVMAVQYAAFVVETKEKFKRFSVPFDLENIAVETVRNSFLHFNN